MNRQIARVSVIALLLLAALVAATTYWQTWAPASLADKQDNAIQRVAQFTIKRGVIELADGTVVADDTSKRVGDQTLYFRRYPQGPLVSDVVGYSTQSRFRTGLERSENDFLTGSNASLSTVLDKLKGATVTGDTLVLTIEPKVQRVALSALAGKCGAAVALDPSTGRVLAMATSPSYDPNLVESDYARIDQAASGAPCRPPAPLLNRATAGLYTPGSTFKIVTTAAALDTGTYSLDSTFVDKGYCIEYGKQVKNFGDQNGPEVFGQVNFTQALEHSINAVYCEIGKRLGAKTILDYARRFGFYSLPPLETPPPERAASGLYDHGKLYAPAQPNAHVDPGRLAFGQERLLATPLQMAMTAATVGNGGVVMQPFLVDRVLSPHGSVVSRTTPTQLGRAVKPQTAAELTGMMVAVVSGGTGTAAQIPGVVVAGKTGTAETGVSHVNTTWFVCFAPAQQPRVAVAVTLEDQSGTGGTTAAPIAKELVQAALGSASKH